MVVLAQASVDAGSPIGWMIWLAPAAIIGSAILSSAVGFFTWRSKKFDERVQRAVLPAVTFGEWTADQMVKFYADQRDMHERRQREIAKIATDLAVLENEMQHLRHKSEGQGTS